MTKPDYQKLKPYQEMYLAPHLTDSDYAVTSHPTDEYNCAAWAFEDTENIWWPGYPEQYYWPERGSKDTINYLLDYLQRHGFQPCKNRQLESGWMKIAIYCNNQGSARHLARQMDDGKWTSKCGDMEDITHELQDLEGGLYGQVAHVLKKKRT